MHKAPYIQLLIILLGIAPLNRLVFSQEVISTGGEYMEDGQYSMSSTAGEVATISVIGVSNSLTQGFQQVYDSLFLNLDNTVRVKLFLQAASTSTALMRTNLRSQGILPLTHPYGITPWNYQGIESFAILPQNAVDWILIELRSTTDTIIARRAGILLDNGIIIDTNMQPGLDFGTLASGTYYIVADHRNHLPVMTSYPVSIPFSLTWDFSDPANFPVFGGNQALFSLNSGNYGLIAGDINKNQQIKYSGAGNDRSYVLQRIYQETGSTSITTVTQGYFAEDINLDGNVKYSGAQNDPSQIIQGIIQMTGSNAITSVFNGVVPSGQLKK